MKKLFSIILFILILMGATRAQTQTKKPDVTRLQKESQSWQNELDIRHDISRHILTHTPNHNPDFIVSVRALEAQDIAKINAKHSAAIKDVVDPKSLHAGKAHDVFTDVSNGKTIQKEDFDAAVAELAKENQ